MTLKSIIEKLKKYRADYIAEHGAEPHVFSLDSEALLLCADIVKIGRATIQAKKPYSEKPNPFGKALS